MSTSTILVTGATGFVGQHLLQELAARSGRLVGLARNVKEASHNTPQIQWVSCDLCRAQDVKAALQSIQPDAIYHLAGQAMVAQSWKDPSYTFSVNVDAQIILLEALKALQMKPRILVAGSSEEYGLVRQDELPVNEENRLRPLSPYAVTKIAQDLMAYQYFRSYGSHVVRTRAFNHTGPGRPDTYAVSGWAKQIAAIELGIQDNVLWTGNLEAKRDYLDVRDVVRAYTLALDKGVPGEVYNVCSGRAWRMQELLDKLLALTSSKISVCEDPARLRPSDIPETCGDPKKFQSLTGWQPQIPMEKTLHDLLDDWRKKLKSAGRPLKGAAPSSPSR